MNLKINLTVFYKMGIFLFTIIALANTYTLLHNWNFLILSSKISSMASILFNISLVGLFGYFYSTMPKSSELIGEEKEKEIESFLETLKD